MWTLGNVKGEHDELAGVASSLDLVVNGSHSFVGHKKFLYHDSSCFCYDETVVGMTAARRERWQL